MDILPQKHSRKGLTGTTSKKSMLNDLYKQLEKCDINSVAYPIDGGDPKNNSLDGLQTLITIFSKSALMTLVGEILSICSSRS